MATNWQPPFGMPFDLPPQQPQQPQFAQSEGQGGPSDPYQAPTPGAFTSPWNLPGLNLQSYGQNAQQPQYPPGAWPPPTQTPDAWSQMQIQFPFLMQNGVIPPPPIPGLNYPPVPQPQTPHTPLQSVHGAAQSSFLSPAAQPFQPIPQPLPARIEHLADAIVAENDKEDGELSERDQTVPPPTGSARAYPEPPRSIPQSITRLERKPSSTQQEGYNPDQPSVGQKFQSSAQQETKQPDMANASNSISQQREEAKRFVRLLHSNNISYHALAAEGLDSGPLRDLYRSLNLPSEPEPVPPAKSASSKAPTDLTASGYTISNQILPNANGAKPATIIKTNVAAVPPSKSAPSPTDRKEYIARLQAAKLAKQNAMSKITPPQKTPPAISAVPTTTKTSQPSAATNAAQPPTEDEKKARQTELIKQRLLALQQNSSSPATTPASRMAVPSPGLSQAVSQSSPSVTNTPKPQAVLSPTYSGIPGLFMNSPSIAQPMQSPSVPQQDSRVASSRKRPFDADMTTTTPSSVNIEEARPPRKISESESMAPDVSDGEFGGSEMDMSDDHISKPSTVTPSASARNGQHPRNVPVIPDYPSRATSVNAPVSSVSTPGPQTPASLARTEELDRKEKELADMRTKLQKKLREQRERKLLAAASSPKLVKPAQDPSIQSATQPNLQLAANAPPHTANGDQDMIRESKRRRRAEIESGLPSLEAEIANNAARMAQLTKEMEQLAANNEKMKQDKEQLVQELESLGIDTEGMPHAELIAKKDEIEREQEAASTDHRMSSELPVEESAQVGNRTTVFIPPFTVAEVEEAPRPTGSSAQDAPNPINIISPVHQTGIPGLNASIMQQSTIAPIQSPSARSNIHKLPMETAQTYQIPAVGQDIPESEAPYEVAPAYDSMDREARALTELQQPATPFDDEEDFYSPEPAAGVPANEDSGPQTTSHQDAKSLSEEGEVAMEESEEEYEPEEPWMLHDPTPSQAIIQSNAAVRSPSASSLTSSEDEDAYEPPDIEQSMINAQPNQSNVDSEAVTQPGEADDAMDISTSSDESDDSDSNYDSTSQPAVENTSSKPSVHNKDAEQSATSNNATLHIRTLADDRALEPQTQFTTVPAFAVEEPVVPAEIEAELAKFLPYESPLKMFKSYRYHPNYAQDVPSGFLSMTYSHQIDPHIPLCPTEATGATCNDAQCSHQHFQGMNISGEKLLVQLGTANPGKTPDERQRWNDGLRSVLKDLRQRNTKDPNGIAMEIAKYRRQFLNDDSRVVNL